MNGSGMGGSLCPRSRVSGSAAKLGFDRWRREQAPSVRLGTCAREAGYDPFRKVTQNDGKRNGTSLVPYVPSIMTTFPTTQQATIVLSEWDYEL